MNADIHDEYYQQTMKRIESIKPPSSGGFIASGWDVKLTRTSRTKKARKTDAKLFGKLMAELGHAEDELQQYASACPSCGSESACKIYEDHAYCFSCRKYIDTAVLKEQLEISEGPMSVPPASDQGDKKNQQSIMAHEPIAQYAAERNESPSPDSLFVALSIASALIADKINLRYFGSPLRGNDYYLNIAGTTSGKSGKLDIIKEHLDGTEYDSNVASGQVMFDVVSQAKTAGVGKAEKIVEYESKPGVVLVDEMDSFLAAVHSTNSTLASAVKQLYACAGTYSNRSKGNLKDIGKTKQSVKRPVLTISALGTKGVILNPTKGFTTDLQESGFVNRFFILPSESGMLSAFTEKGDGIRQAAIHPLLASWLPSKRVMPSYNAPNTQVRDFITDEVCALVRPKIEQLQNDYVKERDDGHDTNPWLARLHVHLLKILLLFGYMSGNNTPSKQNAIEAIRAVEISEKYVLDLISEAKGGIISNTWTATRKSMEESMRYIIRSLSNNPKFVIEDGWVSVTEVARRMRKGGAVYSDAKRLFKEEEDQAERDGDERSYSFKYVVVGKNQNKKMVKLED